MTQKLLKRTPTQNLAEFLCLLNYEQIPEGVIDRIKCSVLDGIACGYFGSTSPWGEIMKEFVQEQESRQESTLWATEIKAQAINTVLALGTFIHAYDFDDYHNAKVHPGAVVIPVALALAEREGFSGKDFLLAVVCGYETMIRVSLSVNPNSARSKGWHLTGTCGVFGAAAAAGKIMGLNVEQMTWALGLAGTQASGLWAFNMDGAMSKRFHPGRASQSGILAVELAKKGFSGPKHILDAEDGGIWSATSNSPNPEELLCDIGEIFRCEETNIKPHASCASTHSAIDAVHEIMDKQDFEIENIEEIVILTSEGVKTQTGFDYLPENVLQAQMSIKYAVALALKYRTILPYHMEKEYFSSSELRELMKKVSVKIDQEMDEIYPKHFCNKVRIHMKDGNSYECKVLDPFGSKERPLSWDNVVEKGRAIVSGTLLEERFDEMLIKINGLENVENISSVSEILKI